jgi:hypothetical protein
VAVERFGNAVALVEWFSAVAIVEFREAIGVAGGGWTVAIVARRLSDLETVSDEFWYVAEPVARFGDSSVVTIWLEPVGSGTVRVIVEYGV